MKFVNWIKIKFKGEWLDLANFEDFEELAQALKMRGLPLEDQDAEHFAKHYEIEYQIDLEEKPYVSNLYLAKIIYESDVLEDTYNFNLAMAVIEELGEWVFIENVEADGFQWGDGYELHYCTPAEFIEQRTRECREIPTWLESYIDWEAMANDQFNNEYFYKNERGILEVY